jgi:hypothetical protein
MRERNETVEIPFMKLVCQNLINHSGLPENGQRQTRFALFLTTKTPKMLGCPSIRGKPAIVAFSMGTCWQLSTWGVDKTKHGTDGKTAKLGNLGGHRQHWPQRYPSRGIVAGSQCLVHQWPS